MSFVTVVPYALIIDGPQALRWWTSGADADGTLAWDVAAEAYDAENGDGGGVGGEGDEDMEVDTLGSLALYLGVSGVLLFLHSAVSTDS